MKPLSNVTIQRIIASPLADIRPSSEAWITSDHLFTPSVGFVCRSIQLQNTLCVREAYIPVARRCEGRRSMVTMSTGALKVLLTFTLLIRRVVG